MLLADSGSRPIIGRGTLLKLLDLHSDVDLRLVSKVPYAGLVRQDRLINIVLLKVAWKLVNSDVAKDDLVDSLFIVLTNVLAFLLNVVDSEFLDDLLDTVL